ncbi:MAG: TrpB-like pyridoxal phosphate-dependent enzyme [Thaumarchaeota archaeon]|nr:TrpB-like pyridoxal phosphate-dependent enzyme [Nitrososphaerota archaeon]MCL5318039.1 TrpB-like pyridoxal phosphate-dependent enzyme [Nitrososphaerota archaeon]
MQVSLNSKVDKEHAVFLPSDEVPTSWYNILPDLPAPLPPPLNPQTKQPFSDPAPLFRIFAKELVMQEMSSERWIKIPDEVYDAYQRLPRPTPLVRAKRLENYLKTPAEIYYKSEYISPAGSHKPNTAIAQAYYNKAQGIERLVTETGAGQWGSALAMSTNIFDLKCRVYMVSASYRAKPGRKTMMEIWGAEVFSSPSNNTKFGRKLLADNPNHNGSLGIAISEAIEDTLQDDNTRYCLGSVLNHVLLHQTVIGLEAKKQFEMIDVYPDVVCGCIGGGSNFAGFAYPFIADKLQGKTETEFVACESKAVPSTTKGTYTYDFGDTAEMTPLLKMYTVGHNYLPPPIHAGGLRYHGKAPSLCLLIDKGYIKPVAYHQTEIFEAARIFAQTEGMITAPETAHNIKYAIDEALRCKKTGEKKVIAFNNCGHGLLDLQAYENFLAGKLTDWEPTEIKPPHYV